jgi:hypothetical protein
MKSVTGHVLDQWKLEKIETLEVKDNKLHLRFGKNHKVVEITPRPNEVMETYELLLNYLTYLGDFKKGKISLTLELPIYYGLNRETTISERINTCNTVDTLLRAVENRLKVPRDPQWGLVETRAGEWLLGPQFIGSYNPANLVNGLEYRPYKSPILIQLADGSVFLAYINFSLPVNKVIEEISQILGITPTGLGLGLGATLLSYYSSLSQQLVSPSGAQILNCIHCMLPSHDLNNEISLDLGYSRAKHVINNFNVPYLSSNDIRELKELEQRIDSGTDRPISRLPSIARYLNIISKEVIYPVSTKENSFDLIISEEHIRIKDKEGNILHSWPLPTLSRFVADEYGISLRIDSEPEELYYKSSESNEIHRCITSFIDIVVFKKDRSRQKKKLLPIHDPDHESTVREGRFLADQIINKLKAKQIEYLDLSWTAIRGSELQKICDLLGMDECVRNVNMSGYGYGTTEILQVLSSIKNSVIVDTLNLSYCGLDDQAALSIGEFLKTNKSVKTLNLTLNPYSKIGFSHILSGLKENNQVKIIHLQVPDLDLMEDLNYFFERQYRTKQQLQR